MKPGPRPPQSSREGDHRSDDCLEEMFARCEGELLGTLCYLLGNMEDARDALQETFVKCWRHRAKQCEIVNLRAWIFCIALNTGRDLRRSGWRRRRSPMMGDEAMLVDKTPDPDARLERQEQLARVRAAITQLRAEEQEVFLLRQNGDMTYDEIAEAVGIPLGTVKTRMRLALGKLRSALT